MSTQWDQEPYIEDCQAMEVHLGSIGETIELHLEQEAGAAASQKANHTNPAAGKSTEENKKKHGKQQQAPTRPQKPANKNQG